MPKLTGKYLLGRYAGPDGAERNVYKAREAQEGWTWYFYYFRYRRIRIAEKELRDEWKLIEPSHL